MGSFCWFKSHICEKKSSATAFFSLGAAHSLHLSGTRSGSVCLGRWVLPLGHTDRPTLEPPGPGCTAGMQKWGPALALFPLHQKRSGQLVREWISVETYLRDRLVWVSFTIFTPKPRRNWATRKGQWKPLVISQWDHCLQVLSQMPFMVAASPAAFPGTDKIYFHVLFLTAKVFAPNSSFAGTVNWTKFEPERLHWNPIRDKL